MDTSKKETALDFKNNYINDLNFCSKTMKLLNRNYAGWLRTDFWHIANILVATSLISSLRIQAMFFPRFKYINNYNTIHGKDGCLSDYTKEVLGNKITMHLHNQPSVSCEEH